jgi:hypothetical protein
MIVAGCDQVDWVVHLHQNRDALCSLPSQSSFVVAPESKDASISSQYNRMKSTARHSINCLIEQWVMNRQLFVIVFFLFIIFAFVESEHFDISQTKRFSRIGTVGRKPKLIWLSTSINIEFQIRGSEYGSTFLLHDYAIQSIKCIILLNLVFTEFVTHQQQYEQHSTYAFLYFGSLKKFMNSSF